MIRLSLFILVVLTRIGNANPAIVKSGEHETFSRLVIYSGANTSWSESRDGTTFRVTLEDFSEGFDLDEVFELIPRTRIAEIDATDGELVIRLGCDCTTSIEPIERVGLLIDIQDPPPEPEFPLQAAQDERSPDPMPRTLETGTGTLLRPEASEYIRKFRSDLARSVTEAANRQLLDPVVSPMSANSSELGLEVFGSDRIRASSAIERAAGANPNVEKEQIGICPDENLVAIEEWTNGSSFSQQISEIRRQFLDEPGFVKEDEAMALTRLYLAFAMTAEARQTVVTFELEGDGAAFAERISHIIDGSTGNHENVFGKDCRGPSSIWSALSEDNDRANRLSLEQSKEISRAFFNIPREVQRIIGPRLISRLNQAGHQTSADIVKGTIANPFAVDGDEPVSQARLLLADQDEMMQLLARKDERSPEIMVQILQESWDRRVPLADETFSVIQSFAFELRNSDKSEEIRAGLIRNLVLRERVIEALDMVAELVETDAFQELVAEIADKTIALEDDAKFAKASLRLSEQPFLNALEVSQKSKVSSRLAGLDLPELARTYSPGDIEKPSNTISTSENAKAPNPDAPLQVTASLETARESLRRVSASRGAIEAMLQGAGEIE
ncbi:hypothetical protein C8N43_2235 [Litoreibacter ponti]|uniref:Uncharacterized protein n=1 Tax=Litoreibacter ponti TaxID=1510457 RepID=A0A2T6BNB8_9RHOB|nr:hypothetical protein [Litoreibacter ponti]PTX57565.1 hypothetical protein C8N43_2235 [Litoreibacter ponti]